MTGYKKFLQFQFFPIFQQGLFPFDLCTVDLRYILVPNLGSSPSFSDICYLFHDSYVKVIHNIQSTIMTQSQFEGFRQLKLYRLSCRNMTPMLYVPDNTEVEVNDSLQPLSYIYSQVI